MESTAIQFIASLLITIVGFFLAYFFTKNPKLRFFYSAVTEIPLPPPIANNIKKESENVENANIQKETTIVQPATLQENLIVRSHTVVVTNQGNATAHNVRIGHFILPAHAVYPPMNVPFETKNPKNEILIPTLSPKESVTISYLYDNKLHVSQINSYIKCNEGLAEVANLQHVSVKSPFLRNILGIIFFIGMVTVVYWVIKIGICLYKICAITNS